MTVRASLQLAACLSVAIYAQAALAQAEDKPVSGGTLIVPVHYAEPSTFDCNAANPTFMYRAGPHYSNLVDMDPERYPAVRGDLARSWTVSSDGLTYEFKLHPNVKFHDGSVLTSNDIKASFDRMRNPPAGVVSLRRAMYDDIESIDTPDSTTVVFRLKDVNAAMLQLLAAPGACIYSAKLLASDPMYPSKKVMGTGPYRFVRYTAGSEWVGERFEGYFKSPLPYLDGFRAISISSSAVVNAMASGQVHYSVRGLTQVDADRIQENRKGKVRMVGGTGATGVTQMITINTQRPPLNDVRVRRALNLALDRWSGAKALERFTAVHIPGGLVRPGSEFARTAKELEALPGFSRDIEASRREARQLLAQAGHPNLKISFVNRKDSAFYGVYLADQLRHIGVTLDHQLFDAAQHQAMNSAGNYDLMLGVQPEFLDDPTVQLSYYRPYKNNPLNSTRTEDARLEALFLAQKRALDPRERKARVQELEAYIVQEAYALPMFWQSWRRTISSDVGGLQDMPSNLLKTDLSDIWLRPATR